MTRYSSLIIYHLFERLFLRVLFNFFISAAVKPVAFEMSSIGTPSFKSLRVISSFISFSFSLTAMIFSFSFSLSLSLFSSRPSSSLLLFAPPFSLYLFLRLSSRNRLLSLSHPVLSSRHNHKPQVLSSSSYVFRRPSRRFSAPCRSHFRGLLPSPWHS